MLGDGLLCSQLVNVIFMENAHSPPDEPIVFDSEIFSN